MHKDRPTPSNRLNFTKRVLDRLTLPSEGVAYFYDTDTKGLAISVGKTGRLVVIDESPPRCSLAADIAGLVADRGFRSLRAPVKQVTCPHTPVPFAPALEDEYMPNPRRIMEAARAVLAA